MASFQTKHPSPFYRVKGGAGSDIIEILARSFPLVEVADTNSDLTWVKVAKFFNNIVGEQGWIERANLNVVDAPQPLPDIDLEIFTEEVLSVEFVFNRKQGVAPFFADADYLLALANIETGIRNTTSLGPRSDRIGPFALSSDEWAEFLASEFTEEGFDPFDIASPLHQVNCAAFQMRSAAQQLSALQALEGVGSLENPYLPRFGELLRARMIGVDRTFEMQKRLKSGNGDQSLPEFLSATGMASDEVTALLNYRRLFMRSGGTMSGDALTLKGFHDKCAEVLNAELSTAFERIRKFVPEAIETPANTAHSPWMVSAKSELVAKISEDDAAGRQRITGYFDATGTNGTADTPWCAAFVAWCMAQGGVKASYDHIRSRAAAAASWREWGDVDINLKDNPPVGAVVVLAPSRETDNISHVGFFKSYDDGARLVTILGGNQSNRVSEVPFKAADVVAIRWQSIRAATSAIVVVPGSPIPNGREDIAQIIVEEFAAAGYGIIQQIAALANAIEESGLKPTARGDGELSVGLFQCHTTKGEGIGHAIEDLEDPHYNTKVIIKAANRYGAFANANSIEDAVDVFVRRVERPKHKEAEIKERTKVAKKLASRLLA
ncbi:TIGR02594 family protein (plasmid) [Ensifer adhaerens]